MKSIATLSDQYIGLQFRKDNGLPIDPTNIHFKGKVYTNPNAPFEFEINKGVLTNCIIKYNLVVLHIVPNLKSGTVTIEGNRFTSKEDILGKYVKQELDINITANADVRNLQDYAIADVILYGDDISTQGIDPNEVKSIVDNYLALNLKGLVSPIIQNELAADVTAVVTKAINDNLPNAVSIEITKVLSNKVDVEIAKQLATKLDDAIKAANLAKNDLEDVDLPKLFEKGKAAGLAAKDLSNITAAAITKIKSIFGTARFEELAPVDLSGDSFANNTSILFVAQISQNNQVFNQTLPPVANKQIILVELIHSSGITGGSLVISPNAGEKLDGKTTTKITITKDGFAGMFIPITEGDENYYHWVSISEVVSNIISVTDYKGNVIPNLKNLNFKKPLFIEHDDTTDTTNVNIETVPFVFQDTFKGSTFKAELLKSLDKSIKISSVEVGRDNNGNIIYEADLSVVSKDEDNGIFATLGSDEVINSKDINNRLLLHDVKVKGSQFIYQDIDTKSFIIQDVNPQDDPVVSGGTTILVAVYFEPSAFETNRLITQQGNIQIGLMDDNNQFMTDMYGKPMYVQIDYEANSKERKELYIGQIKAKAFTRVHYGIKSNFPIEESISVSSKSCIMLQAITKDNSYGKALAAFMQYTGYNINFNNKYYGVNSLSLAKYLEYPKAEQEISNINLYFGDDVHMSFKTSAKVKVENKRLTITDNGTDLPVFSIYKEYNKIDTALCKGLSLNVSAKIKNKQNAFVIALLKYTGNENDIPSPEVLRYDNDNPVFNNGWFVEDSLFIAKSPAEDVYDVDKTFNVPFDVKSTAVIIYAENSQMPTELILDDFKVDIVPEFNHVFITTNEEDDAKYIENQKGYIKSKCYTPSCCISLRYTANDTDTKIPVGTVTGDKNVINDNSWNDVGSTDPDKLQGDYKFLVDGNISSAQYGVLVKNDTDTINNVELWWAKANVDGSFTEIPNSRIATTIEANRVIPKVVTSGYFNFDVSANDRVAVFMKSDKVDGFYIESVTDGKPFYWSSMIFNEKVEIDKEIIKLINENKVQFTKAGKPVNDASKYSISIDVDTNKITVISK